MNPLPPIDTSAANLAYISALKPGEEVIECGNSCMKGIMGTVYRNDAGVLCVMWDMPTTKWDKACKMGTSITWGTRRTVDLVADIKRLEKKLFGK